jgi:hypothetical protein
LDPDAIHPELVNQAGFISTILPDSTLNQFALRKWLCSLSLFDPVYLSVKTLSASLLNCSSRNLVWGFSDAVFGISVTTWR